MTKKNWIIFAVISVVILGGLVYLSGRNRVDVSSVEPNSILTPSDQSGNIGDHVYGNKNSKVQLIEYGDFQCPGCGSVHPTVQSIKEKYKDDIAFVFRNFPLTSIHPNALVAAATAEAAGKQGKYWQMHDKLYTQQDTWSNATINDRTNVFSGYASEVGLDIDRYNKDLTDPNITKKINFDLALGKDQGVTSTPTFYLNGRELDQDTWGTLEKFEKAIDDEIAKQK